MRRTVLLLLALAVVVSGCTGVDPERLERLRDWTAGQAVVEAATERIEADTFGDAAALQITLRPDAPERDVHSFSAELWAQAGRLGLRPRVVVGRSGVTAPLGRDESERRDDIALMYALLDVMGPHPDPDPPFGSRGGIDPVGDIRVHTTPTDQEPLARRLSDPAGPAARAVAARRTHPRSAQITLEVTQDGRRRTDLFAVGEGPLVEQGRGLVMARHELVTHGGPDTDIKQDLLAVRGPIDPAQWRRVVGVVAPHAPRGGVTGTVDGVVVHASFVHLPPAEVAEVPARLSDLPAGLSVVQVTARSMATLTSDVPLTELRLEGWKEWPLARLVPTFRVKRGDDDLSWSDEAELQSGLRLLRSVERGRSAAPSGLTVSDGDGVSLAWTAGDVTDEQLVAVFRALRDDHGVMGVTLDQSGPSHAPARVRVRFRSTGRGTAINPDVSGAGARTRLEAEKARLVGLWDSTAG